MLKVSIILAHPKKGSFNHALAEAAVAQLEENGCKASFHDLYEERFAPALPCGESERGAVLPEEIKLHCEELAEADGIIVVHPNWWGMPPAIMKGWIDRVFRAGLAYEFLEGDSGEGVPRPLLKLKTALVFNSSNTEARREREVFGDPLEAIWRNCAFGLCAKAEFRRRMFGVVATSSESQRKDWLAEARRIVAEAFPKGKALR